MRYLLYSLLAAAIAGGAVVGSQQSPPPPEPPDAKAEQDPSAREKDAQTKAQEEEELEPFTPSEKVPIDSAISFPIDI